MLAGACRIEAGGGRPNIVWHLLAYLVLTVAEVLVSVTGLEFSYTQAPRRMKSLVMAFWLLAVALGNAFTSLVNLAILDEEGGMRWTASGYYAFFVVVMSATATAFVPFACCYRERAYVHGETDGHEHRAGRCASSPSPAFSSSVVAS